MEIIDLRRRCCNQRPQRTEISTNFMRGRSLLKTVLFLLGLSLIGVACACVGVFLATGRKVARERTRSEEAWMMVAVDRILEKSNSVQLSQADLHNAIHNAEPRIQYLDRRLRDVWGNAYQFAFLTNGSQGALHILSSGPDGHFSTSDDIGLFYSILP